MYSGELHVVDRSRRLSGDHLGALPSALWLLGVIEMPLFRIRRDGGSIYGKTYSPLSISLEALQNILIIHYQSSGHNRNPTHTPYPQPHPNHRNGIPPLRRQRPLLRRHQKTKPQTQSPPRRAKDPLLQTRARKCSPHLHPTIHHLLLPTQRLARRRLRNPSLCARGRTAAAVYGTSTRS